MPRKGDGRVTAGPGGESGLNTLLIRTPISETLFGLFTTIGVNSESER